MDKLKDPFHTKIDAKRKEVKDFVVEYGDTIIGEIKISQLYGGMRGMKALITETSKLDPAEGIRFRGYSIPELQEKLPHYPGEGNEQPLPEGIFYLMLFDEMPDDDIVRRVSNNWVRRAQIPPHVFKVIDALPSHTHPMSQFVCGIMALRTDRKSVV